MNWRQFVDNSPTNQYGEKAASVVTHVDDGVLRYRCRDDAWAVAHKHWRDARRTDRSAPQPMPAGHCMFVSPLSYGCVVEGESREHVIRRALRRTVVSSLNSWDRELRKTPEGMRTLAKIVRATVDAKLAGNDPGAAPFVACIANL